MITTPEFELALNDLKSSFSKWISVVAADLDRRMTLIEQRGGEPGLRAEAERYVNKDDLARHLGVSSRTVENYMRRGKIPYLKLDQAIRFRVSEVDQYLKERSEIRVRSSSQM